MRLRHLWLTDFRSYAEADLELGDGLTAICGPNGHGKTNILEAVGLLATLDSFRGSPSEALVRAGAARSVVRAEGEREGRDLLIEVELVVGGRTRAQVNRQRLARTRDLLGAIRVSVFAPDDLVLVKGGPGERRRYLDDLLVAEHPARDPLRTELERVLRQRGALLRQAGGRLTPDIEVTLDVWDTKLADVGERVAAARADALDRLAPLLATAYDEVAERPSEVRVRYDAPWRASGLAAALLAARRDDLRRGVTTVGPHRDDLVVTLGGLPARTHASQGEQRSLALALRLAGHRLVSDAAGTPPVLLLDDVFSELDPDRSDALLRSLPEGQTLLTTAGPLPPRARPDQVLDVRDSRVTRRAPGGGS